MNKITYFSGLLLTVFFLNACGNKETNTDPEVKLASHDIQLTRTQFETGKMAIGQAQEHVFTEAVSAKGYIQATPDGLAKVGVFVPGTVKNIRHKTGEWVNKGDVLFELTGTAIIQLQQDYAQNHARLMMAGQELERMQGLLDQNIVSQRDFQTASTEFTVLKANDEALAAQLKMNHLKPENVADGKLVNSVPVLATMSGYISKQELMLGQYLEPQHNPVELVDTRKLQLNLNVFEKDLSLLQTDQKVLFYSPGHKHIAYEARLKVVGKSIDQESKTIVCSAIINEPEQAQFVHGMYVECEVLTCERTALALPTEAIIKDGYNHYVLVKTTEDDKGYNFSRKPVDIGRETLEFTEVLNTDLKDVLVKGVYNLNVEE